MEMEQSHRLRGIDGGLCPRSPPAFPGGMERRENGSGDSQNEQRDHGIPNSDPAGTGLIPAG